MPFIDATRSKTICIVALAASLPFLTGCPETPSGSVSYEITIENLTTGQPISPIAAALHSNSISLFRIGAMASADIEAIAEDGDNSGLVTSLESNALVSDLMNVGQPLLPQGIIVGEFMSDTTFTLTAAPGDVFSMVGMLIATNDGLVGLDAVALPETGTKIYYALGYDAGTEDNTELSEHLVDPASALGPVMLDGDPDGNLDTEIDTTPHETIALHPTIQGGGDLSVALHGWLDPAVVVTITRIEP